MSTYSKRSHPTARDVPVGTVDPETGLVAVGVLFGWLPLTRYIGIFRPYYRGLAKMGLVIHRKIFSGYVISICVMGRSLPVWRQWGRRLCHMVWCERVTQVATGILE